MSLSVFLCLSSIFSPGESTAVRTCGPRSTVTHQEVKIWNVRRASLILQLGYAVRVLGCAVICPAQIFRNERIPWHRLKSILFRKLFSTPIWPDSFPQHFCCPFFFLQGISSSVSTWLLLTVRRAGDKPAAERYAVRDVCRLSLSFLELSGERDS